MQYNTTKYIDENQDNETLKDMTKSGTQRPWREKKIDNVSGSVAKLEKYS
ncbi:replication protein [Staphylococcus aureus]|nr:replication protein [Staphylococcus aureus]